MVVDQQQAVAPLRESRRREFWRDPRRTLLRKAFFQVHLWAGLLVCLYVAAISLSGSILVFNEEFQRWLTPHLFHVERPQQIGSIDAALRAVHNDFPSSRILGLDNLHSSHDPLVCYLAPSDPHAPTRDLMVYVDRSEARILGSRGRYQGFLGWCANLHYYLLAGRIGALANGLLAIAFTVVCLTGYVIWWPGLRRWKSGLRVHWKARWKRLNWDLHSVFGFWANPALILVVLTGVYFEFPRPIANVVASLSGDNPGIVDQHLASPSSRGSFQGEPATVDEICRKMRIGLGPDLELKYLSLPDKSKDVFLGLAYETNAAPYSRPIDIYADRGSGDILRIEDARKWHWGLRMLTYVYAVHFGSFAGLPSKILWFVLGLLSTALAITGVILYWNRYLKNAWNNAIRR